MIITFAWTTAAVQAGRKCRTRRYWLPEYAARFKLGRPHKAYDRSPRNHGHCFATIELTREPYLQSTADMTEEDYEAEGLAWMEEQGLTIRGKTPRHFFEDWKARGEMVYVVCFLPWVEREALEEGRNDA